MKSPDKVYQEVYAETYAREVRQGASTLAAVTVATKKAKAAKKEQKEKIEAAEQAAKQAEIEAASAAAVEAALAATEAREAPRADSDRPRTTGRPTAPASQAQGRPSAYRLYVLDKGGRASVEAVHFGGGSVDVTVTSPSPIRVMARRGQVSVQLGRGSGIVCAGVELDRSSPLVIQGEAGAPVLVTVS